MRSVSAAVLTAVLAISVSCGPKKVTLPAVGVARFPEFLEPTIPSSFSRSPAAAGQGRAWRLLQTGDLRSAEREAVATLKGAADFYPVETTVAYIQLARRDAEAAVLAFDRVLDRHGDYVPALVGKGQALEALERDDDAVATFEIALRLAPALTDVSRRRDVVRFRSAQRSIALARQAAGASRFDEAIKAYRAALALTPDSAFLYRELAAIERDHGSGDAAIEHYRRAISLDPADAEALVDLAAMLDARNDFQSALDAYGAALALAPDASIAARRDALRLRAAIVQLPAEYREIESTAQATRGDVAALIGFRLRTLLNTAKPRDVGVITDIRGHWAEPWMLEVSRAGIMDPFDNHTFQPRAIVRRVDFAQTLMRVLQVTSSGGSADWQGARGSFPDVASGNVAHSAVSAVVAAGVMQLADDGSFQPSRAVSGAEATAAVVRILALAGGARGAASAAGQIRP